MVLVFYRMSTQVDTFQARLLVVLAILVFRSRFFPRLVGVWLIITGFYYLVLSLTGLLLPQYQDTVLHSAFALPAEVGRWCSCCGS